MLLDLPWERDYVTSGTRLLADPTPARLTFRTSGDVGEAAFLDAIQHVSTGSLDRWDREDRAAHGAEGAARNLFQIIQALDYDPGWWQLAYSGLGELVGLVMPAGTTAWSTNRCC